MRVDLNIKDRDAHDSFRLSAVLPTIQLLLKNKIKVVLLSHRGRPKTHTKSLSLRPFQATIAKKINEPVVFLLDVNTAQKIIKNSKNKVFLLENLRFWSGETQNSPIFAKELAVLGDFYVNEAFSFSHRKTASMSAITRFLPAYAGLRFQTEIENLGQIMKGYKHPLTVILGGAKIKEKLETLKYFWKKADYFLLGSSINLNKKLKIKNKKYSRKIILSIDTKAGRDIGRETIKKYVEIIKKSKTAIWNGPMGEFEKREFSDGTKEVWRAILRNKKARIVVGGGETIVSLKLLNTRYQLLITKNRNLFLSTGGGAMLDYLSGKKLPGIETLKKLK